MTSPPVVDLANLKLGSELGSGGQGHVYELRGSPDLVYKKYLEPGKVNTSAMAELILAPQTGGPEWESVLQRTAWISCKVEDQGRLVGVLMRRAPQSFGKELHGAWKLRELQYLLFPPKPAWASLVGISIGERLDIAREVGQLFRSLHRLNIVVGDVSGKNLLWTTSASPRVMLLDCDALRRVGSHPPTHQLHTPDWDDPLTAGGTATLDSDRYKLALIVGRLLTEQPYLRPRGDAMAFLPGVGDSLRAQVEAVFHQAGGSAGQRPNAQQWIDALSDRPRIPLTKTSGLRAAPGEGIPELAMEPEARPIIKMN